MLYYLLFNLLKNMSGHNKWSGIKHRKAAQDSKKAKIYAKMGKLIQLEAMHGGSLELNPGLATAVSNARSAWVPKNVIEKAIAKWSGADKWENLEEIFYEWYGPAGVAMYIKCITPNKNRSASNVRAILTKFGWNMGQAGSVSWQFTQKWVIYTDWLVERKKEKGKDVENIFPLPEDYEDILLEIDVEDYEMTDEGLRIETSRENLINVTKFLEENNYHIKSSELDYIPENFVELSEDDERKMMRIIDALEDDDDVDSIYHNAG